MNLEAGVEEAPQGNSLAIERFWRRYRQNRAAVGGLILCLAIVSMALCAPLITPGVTPDTHFMFSYLGFPEYGPSLAHFPALLFGNTTGGVPFQYSSVLAQITYGARPTLLISLCSAAIAAAIGLLIGAVSGYFGDWVDALLMRITDVFLALPFLPLVIALIVATRHPPTVQSLILMFSAVGWADIARLARANFLVLREQGFTEAAHAVGVGDWRILTRHLLPHAITPIIVATVLAAANFMLAEAVITFLGVGGYIQEVTWGSMIAYAQSFVTNGNWWWVFFPGCFISLTIISLNLIGEGVRDTLDVRGHIQ